MPFIDIQITDQAMRGLASEVRSELLEAKAWDRYDNPFEQKYVLQKKAYTTHMNSLIDHLTGYVVDLPSDIEIDLTHHYTAFFKYVVGDYLDLHMDAGVHPLTGKRKAWTILYYLSTDDIEGSPLEFWIGEKIVDGPNPNLGLDRIIPAEFGTVVLFKNNDNEFHGNPGPVMAGTRLVATTSFVCQSHEGHTNMNERAYFIPSVRKWAPETFVLRDKRCDATEYVEVYKAGVR